MISVEEVPSTQRTDPIFVAFVPSCKKSMEQHQIRYKHKDRIPAIRYLYIHATYAYKIARMISKETLKFTLLKFKDCHMPTLHKLQRLTYCICRGQT